MSPEFVWLNLASTKAISEGASNTSKLKRLYPGNTGLDAAAKKAESKKGTPSDALKELEKARFKLGEDGYTSDRISAYRSAMANYINQFFDDDEIMPLSRPKIMVGASAAAAANKNKDDGSLSTFTIMT